MSVSSPIKFINRCIKMKRLKKTAVPCIRNFIKTVASNSSKSEQAALLNDVIKNFECAVNGGGGHECFFVHFPSKCAGGLTTVIAYHMTSAPATHCIAVDPFHDFEDIDD